MRENAHGMIARKVAGDEATVEVVGGVGAGELGDAPGLVPVTFFPVIFNNLKNEKDGGPRTHPQASTMHFQLKITEKEGGNEGKM